MRQLRLLSLTLAVLCGVSNAHAGFVTIDNFTNPNPGQFYRVNPPGQNINPLTIIENSGFGSTRTANFIVNSPLPAPTNALTGTLGGGLLDFNSATFAQAQAILTYTNLTGSSANWFLEGDPTFLYMTFLSLDPGIDLANNSPAPNMPVDVTISTTGGSLTGSFLLAQTSGPTTYQIPFASFAGAADLSQVVSMTFQLNAGPNQRQRADFVLTSIQFESIPAPLPPSILLGIVGVPLLHHLRRRVSA